MVHAASAQRLTGISKSSRAPEPSLDSGASVICPVASVDSAPASGSETAIVSAWGEEGELVAPELVEDPPARQRTCPFPSPSGVLGDWPRSAPPCTARTHKEGSVWVVVALTLTSR